MVEKRGELKNIHWRRKEEDGGEGSSLVISSVS